MARINTTQLVRQTGDAVYRANAVRHDPAVRKAATELGTDATRAWRSLENLADEVLAAWYRNTPGA